MIIGRRRTPRSRSSSQKARAGVADIDEEIVRLNRIVSEVLDFARPIKFELAPVDLNALCEDAVGRPPRRTRCHPAGAGRTLPVTRERLRRVLVNILTNARNAVAARDGDLRPGDPITLSTHRQPPDRIAIDVRDRGTGIAAEDLPRVFDPFFTTRRTGTGLGLAISRNIIEGSGHDRGVEPRRGTDVPSSCP
jgi:two-component system sensor histidine kinase HydH